VPAIAQVPLWFVGREAPYEGLDVVYQARQGDGLVIRIGLAPGGVSGGGW